MTNIDKVPYKITANVRSILEIIILCEIRQGIYAVADNNRWICAGGTIENISGLFETTIT